MKTLNRIGLRALITISLFVLTESVFAQSVSFPTTRAYCLDGSMINVNTRETTYQPPAIGFITFYKDRVVIDNREVYNLWRKESNVDVYTKEFNYMGHSATCYIFVDPKLENVVLFMSLKDVATLKSQIWLMEVDDFNRLWAQNQGISTQSFLDHESSNSGMSAPSSAGTRSYYSERYGYKRCHLCGGTGICSTCNGGGRQSNYLGYSNSECANCHRSGKCFVCHGKGKVYGLK